MILKYVETILNGNGLYSNFMKTLSTYTNLRCSENRDKVSSIKQNLQELDVYFCLRLQLSLRATDDGRGGHINQSTGRCTSLLHLLPISVVSTKRNLTNSLKLFLFLHISSLMKSNPLRFIFLSFFTLRNHCCCTNGWSWGVARGPINPHQKLAIFPLKLRCILYSIHYTGLSYFLWSYT